MAAAQSIRWRDIRASFCAHDQTGTPLLSTSPQASLKVNRLRDVLKTYDLRPRKRLGQAFLEDEQMIRRIAAAALLTSEDVVVEIGSGPGLLTQELAKRAGRVVGLEIDERLVKVLRERFAQETKVTVWSGDALEYSFDPSPQGDLIKVVGNIPYHISTPILFHLLQHRRSIDSMVLMFQKELADRISAAPGGRDYGIPSVLCARYTTVQHVLNVPPGCFYPVPKVVSTVLRFQIKRDLDSLGPGDLFAPLVRAAFAQRRKTLRNNLRVAGISGTVLEDIFHHTRLDGGRRAETLSVEEFEGLASTLVSAGQADIFLDKNGVGC